MCIVSRDFFLRHTQDWSEAEDLHTFIFDCAGGCCRLAGRKTVVRSCSSEDCRRASMNSSCEKDSANMAKSAMPLFLVISLSKLLLNLSPFCELSELQSYNMRVVRLQLHYYLSVKFGLTSCIIMLKHQSILWVGCGSKRVSTVCTVFAAKRFSKIVSWSFCMLLLLV